MWSFFEHINDECVINVLDIGASLSPVESPCYQHLLENRRARLIGFEPDQAECAKLSAAYGEPHRFFPYFIGNGNPATYYQTNHVMTGSLFEPNSELLEKFQQLAECTELVAQHPISTIRLDDIHDIDDVDFIKIDVQGSELSIFQNASISLASAVLIQTEVCFVELYKGQPMSADVDTFLRRNGFQFHTFAGFGSRAFKPLINPRKPWPIQPFRQWVWADAYYVKDWMHLDKLSPIKLQRMAALLHDIVKSYDLAYVALRTLDAKTGSRLAPDYLRRLQEDGLAATHPPVHTSQPVATSPSAVRSPRKSAFMIEIADDLLISAPPSLRSISTYVLLEQERWFEQELDFLLRWLQPGMNAVDIGAHIGAYSLPLARRIGPEGRLFAFEPSFDSHERLDAGRKANRLDNITIAQYALADCEKIGWLQASVADELIALGEGVASNDAIKVRVTSIDLLRREQSWPRIDFVKIDAEGQEERILAGGREFFAENSPLVLYEINHNTKQNLGLRWMFEALGYRAYRLLGDASCLIPIASDEVLDPYELNLFAVKSDCAAQLAAQDLLVLDIDATHVLSDKEREQAVDAWLGREYARAFEFSRADIMACPYAAALTAYAACLYGKLPAARRYAALSAAYREMKDYCATTPTPAGLATLARVALTLGYRMTARTTLEQLIVKSPEELDYPFFPPCARYESISPEDREVDWFIAAALEQHILAKHRSSIFSQDGLTMLKQLNETHFVSPEINRRLVLSALHAGMPLHEAAKLLHPELQHRNASCWTRNGLARLIALR